MLRLKNYQKVITYCNRALAIDPINIKVLFRRGQAYAGLFEYDKARDDLTAVIKIQPNNKEVRKVYDIVKKQHENYKRKQKISKKKYPRGKR